MTTIQILGAPGSGKSTVSAILAEQLDMPLFTEPYEQNEFIPMVAQGIPYYFECEAKMLALTTSQEAIARVTHDGAIIDGGRLQTMGFIRQFVKDGLLTRWEHVKLSKAMADSSHQLKLPDYIFMLEASPTTLKQRVDNRGRSFESNYNVKFLASLQDSIELASMFTGRLMINADRDIMAVVQNIIEIVYKGGC